LPHDILYRPKMGFVTPISEWLKGPLAQTALGISKSPALAQLDWFDGDALIKAAQDHIAGRSNNGRLLWQMIMLEKSLAKIFG
jgi:asparagine synthase (glutamine-hydrolysing)